MKKKLLLILKIVGTIELLALVILSLDLEKYFEIISKVSFFHLLSAFLILAASQVFSSFRLKYILGANGLLISFKDAVKIYWAGMFVNTILPGGVSGDGYIAYNLHKQNNFNWKTGIKCLLSARASGLCVLVFFALQLAWLLLSKKYIPEYSEHYFLFFLFSIPLLVLPYVFLTGIIFKEPKKTSLLMLVYSLPVQLINASSAIPILITLGAGRILEYIFLFLVSNVLSILPISIGGLGVREGVMYLGAEFLDTGIYVGVAFASLYFLVNLALSLVGGVFLRKSREMCNKNTKI